MKHLRFKGVVSAGVLAILLAPGALGQDTTPDFGDDTSMWANDGECDDPRFEGPGMTETELLEADRGHDATDCQAAFNAGEIWTVGSRPDVQPEPTLAAVTEQPATQTAEAPAVAAPVAPTPEEAGAEQAEETVPEPVATPPVLEATPIDFGDDSSMWANDGECDDPRFSGTGMATELLDEDLGKDATDCQALHMAGSITFNPDYVPMIERARALAPAGFEFGNDASRWANDGECDDPRFSGDGANAKLVLADLGRDATDCMNGFASGSVVIVDGAENWVLPIRPDAAAINFGDDTSTWANDGECDDPRFGGAAMAAKMDAGDITHDATDCRAAYINQRIYLK